MCTNDKNLYIIAGCNGAGKTTALMQIINGMSGLVRAELH